MSGHGSARRLAYHVAPLQAGETITFAEQASATFHVLGTAKHARGSLRFRPAAGRAGTRRIVALVTRGGRPARQIVAGHYRASAGSRPRRPPHLKASRRGSSIKLTWGRARGAVRYAVLATYGDGRRSFHVLRARKLTLRGIASTLKATIRVTGVDRGRRSGHAASKRVRAAKASRRHVISA